MALLLVLLLFAALGSAGLGLFAGLIVGIFKILFGIFRFSMGFIWILILVALLGGC